jgi:5-methyltetrahydropteroyltriglutamate--homocysteine methyltransferase
MKSSTDRILTTHAGSLPRPRALVAMLAAKSAGRDFDEAALAAAAEAATRAVIEKQLDAGIDVLNNGEVGRESFFTYLKHRMRGFSGASQRPTMADMIRYPGYIEQLVRTLSTVENVSLMTAPRATSAVEYLGRDPIQAECAQLARLLKPYAGRYEDVFMSSASPGIVAAAMENAYYDSLEEYVHAIGAALRSEYEAIAQAGFVLQIDAPDLAMERHTLFHGKPLGEFLGFMRTVIDALNEALGAIARERVRLHVCWGNYGGPHDLDVGLDEIWAEIARANVGGFLISLANPRHAHEVRLFEGGILPKDAILVPGVIDTTTNYVEHPELVAERIERAAKAIGDPSRVLAGTDCGFETSAGFAAVAPDVVWAKLRALADGAALATKRLY